MLPVCMPGANSEPEPSHGAEPIPTCADTSEPTSFNTIGTFAVSAHSNHHHHHHPQWEFQAFAQLRSGFRVSWNLLGSCEKCWVEVGEREGGGESRFRTAVGETIDVLAGVCIVVLLAIQGDATSSHSPAPMATWVGAKGASWAVHGPHIIVSKGTKVAFHDQTSLSNSFSKVRCREIGSALQSFFYGRQDMKGRVRLGSYQGFEQCWHSRQLRVSYITTEKIVGGRLRLKEAGKRRLILLRHAKSSWADRSLKDHDRPLSKRGRLAAANIANKLEEQGWLPGLILCSDSLRTRETLDIMQEHAINLSEAEVRFLGSFYSVAAMDGQTAQHIQENVLKYSRDDVTTIMCMGHNRGWEEAASLLCGVKVELKTANAALLEAPGGSWQEAFNNSGMGGWKLLGIMKPDTADVEGGVL